MTIDENSLPRYLNDFMDKRTVDKFVEVTADTLTAVKELKVYDKMTFTKNAVYTLVGGTGAPGFTASWTNFGAPYHSASYWLDPLGFVHMRGVIKSGTIGSSAFTLPPGWRPPSTIWLPVVSNAAFGAVKVGADGTVTPASGSNISFSLDNIYYKIA